MNDITHTGFGGKSPANMSTRDIAEITGKQHAHVMRDARAMLVELHGEDGLSKFGSSYRNAQNKEQPEYLLPKRETLILASGYSLDLRTKIIDRCEELERAAREPTGIDVRNLPQLQNIALQLIEVNKEQSDQIAAMAPKVEAMALLEASEGSVGPRLVSKMLNVPERKFTAWLQANHWAFRQNGVGPLQAYVDKRNAGYLEHRPHTYRDHGTGEDKTIAQLLITPKGLAKLASVFAQDTDGV
jgi:phage regulator Rha-like protein